MHLDVPADVRINVKDVPDVPAAVMIVPADAIVALAIAILNARQLVKACVVQHAILNVTHAHQRVRAVLIPAIIHVPDAPVDVVQAVRHVVDVVAVATVAHHHALDVLVGARVLVPIIVQGVPDVDHVADVLADALDVMEVSNWKYSN